MAIDLMGTKIKEMFPSTKTKTINKLITENSLTRLLNRLLDVKGYIITSEYPNNVLVQSDVHNNYDYITVSNDILDVDLEFNIRGYYFNLNTYRNVISLIRTEYGDLQTDDTINAIIYVDETSNPEYPELYGQESLEKITADVAENSYTFPEDCTINNVFNIIIYDNQSVIDNIPGINYELDSNNKLVIKNGDGEIQTPSYNRISYVKATYISSIKLYKSQDKPSKPSGFDYLKEYELTLFKMKDSNTFTIPLSSIHRFSSLAIESIDGGEIPQT